MNIYNIFTAFAIILIHLLQTNDRRVLAPLLDAPEPDTTYLICYFITPPPSPLTIDPSPPVLTPPFDPGRAPSPPHTFVGATSAGCNRDDFSVDWTANFLMVIISGLLVHEAVSWLAACTRARILNGPSLTIRDHPRSYACPAPPISPYPLSPSPPSSSSFWSLTNDPLPEHVPTPPTSVK